MAFKDLDAAILVGSMPRKEGMERKDLLKANVAIFKSQGAALEKYAKKTVKVITAETYSLIKLKADEQRLFVIMLLCDYLVLLTCVIPYLVF